MRTTDVMLCPEACDETDRLEGASRIVTPRAPDGSCWRCEGVGFVPHNGDPTIDKIQLDDQPTTNQE